MRFWRYAFATRAETLATGKLAKTLSRLPSRDLNAEKKLYQKKRGNGYMQINTIYNKDCIEGMATLPDKSIDVAFTSPPYNRIRNDTYAFYDDTKDDYFEFICQVTNELLRLTRKSVIVNIQANHFNKRDVFKYIGKYSENIKHF